MHRRVENIQLLPALPLMLRGTTSKCFSFQSFVFDNQTLVEYNLPVNESCLCRYKPNDYYLEELIEEWCEGVIQDDNQNKEEFSSCNKTYLGRPQSLLLEKVAMHLQKSNSESLTIDLKGLTKVGLTSYSESYVWQIYL